MIIDTSLHIFNFCIALSESYAKMKNEKRKFKITDVCPNICLIENNYL